MKIVNSMDSFKTRRNERQTFEKFNWIKWIIFDFYDAEWNFQLWFYNLFVWPKTPWNKTDKCRSWHACFQPLVLLNEIPGIWLKGSSLKGSK